MHFFGTTAGGTPAASLERQGLASCRYQGSGSRELILVDVPSLVANAGAADLNKSEKESYMNYAAGVFIGIA